MNNPSIVYDYEDFPLTNEALAELEAYWLEKGETYRHELLVSKGLNQLNQEIKTVGVLRKIPGYEHYGLVRNTHIWDQL